MLTLPDLDLIELPAGFVFARTDSYTDAWGHRKVCGTMFDTVHGSVQAGAIAWCNMPADDETILRGALAEALGDPCLAT